MFFVGEQRDGTKLVGTNAVALLNYVSVYVHDHPVHGETPSLLLVGEQAGATVGEVATRTSCCS